MEIRSLTMFLTVLEEGSVSNAAKKLHLTQPTVSRQLAALEDELGVQLYTRSQKGVSPTEQGITLRRYAESIVALEERAKSEVSARDGVSGAVHLAVGDTRVVGFLAKAMIATQEDFPYIQFRMTTGDSSQLMDDLVKGRFDLMLECETVPHVEFDRLDLPMTDTWGLLTRRDNPLARNDAIRPDDIKGIPLILSQQGMRKGVIQQWADCSRKELNVVATYNLPLNLKYLVREGLGSAILYKGLIDCNEENELAFVPLDPLPVSRQSLIWRKVTPNKQTQAFLAKVRELCEAEVAKE
jgi:DNA-binding transcriptional LysR family regulator